MKVKCSEKYVQVYQERTLIFSIRRYGLFKVDLITHHVDTSGLTMKCILEIKWAVKYIYRNRHYDISI